MEDAERQSLLALPVIVAIGLGIGWAGSQGGVSVAGLPVFALCGALSFAINWAVFAHAWVAQTERYFDLTGSLTYATLVAVALAAGDGGPRAWLLGGMVLVWAGRLGSFLFARIRRDGRDARFDAIRPSFVRFLMAWTLQGLWVLLTLACALAAMTAAQTVSLGAAAIAGTLVWLAGLLIEAIADRQKSRFRADAANRDRFIQSGLWAWSRHPNYFGEIVLWLGVAIVAFPALAGWQHATLVSPLFVAVLLTRISGVPLLEARAEKKWGDDPAYRAYRNRTPVLVPRPPQASGAVGG